MSSSSESDSPYYPLALSGINRRQQEILSTFRRRRASDIPSEPAATSSGLVSGQLADPSRVHQDATRSSPSQQDNPAQILIDIAGCTHEETVRSQSVTNWDPDHAFEHLMGVNNNTISANETNPITHATFKEKGREANSPPRPVPRISRAKKAVVDDDLDVISLSDDDEPSTPPPTSKSKLKVALVSAGSKGKGKAVVSSTRYKRKVASDDNNYKHSDDDDDCSSAPPVPKAKSKAIPVSDGPKKNTDADVSLKYALTK